jgi:hypothetical protein
MTALVRIRIDPVGRSRRLSLFLNRTGGIFFDQAVGVLAMSQIVMNRETHWQQVAMFEVYGSEQAAVETLMRGLAADGNLRLRQVAPSPDGYAWYECEVDFSHGERRAIYVASRLIEALERAPLRGYRLIGGREWMNLAMAQAALEKSAGRAM